MEAKTIEALRKQLLDEHHATYVQFTKQLLTLAAGCLSLLTALAENIFPSPGELSATISTKLAWPLLLSSMLAGLLVQHRLLQRPIDDLVRAERQNSAPGMELQRTFLLRRQPSLVERHAFQWQLASFVLAFCALSAAVLLR